MRVLLHITLVTLIGTALGLNIPPEVIKQKHIVSGVEKPKSIHETPIVRKESHVGSGKSVKSVHDHMMMEENMAMASTSSPPVEVQARLSGSNETFEGYVEVLYGGTWGRICDDAWDLNDATVVCQQLGFATAIQATTSSQFYTGTSDEFLMDEVACSGSERNIGLCPFNGWGAEDCFSGEVAGVVCDGVLPVTTGAPTTVPPITVNRTAFAVVFSPVPGGFVDGVCAILLTAEEATFFTVRSVDSFFNGLLQAGEGYRYNVSCNFRTSNATERKTFYINSNKTLSVVLVNNPGSDQNDMEATAVYPVGNEATDFYLVTFTNQAGNTNQCPSTGTRTFFTVAPYFDDTVVEVYSYPNYQLVLNITLMRFEVYTYTYSGPTQQDFSGWRVVSSRAVSVTAGNVCTQASYPATATTNAAGLTWNYIPPVSALDSGTHISFNIYNPGSNTEYYYAVLVLAIQANTAVTIAGLTDYVLARGDLIHYQGGNVPFSIRCGNPCLVMQVNNNFNGNTGVFMVHVPAVSTWVQDAVFSVLPTYTGGTYPLQYVRIVTTQSPPVNINIVGLLEVQGWQCGQANSCHYVGSFQSGTSPPARIYATPGTAANFTAIVIFSDKFGEGFGYNVHVPVIAN